MAGRLASAVWTGNGRPTGPRYHHRMSSSCERTGPAGPPRHLLLLATGKVEGGHRAHGKAGREATGAFEGPPRRREQVGICKQEMSHACPSTVEDSFSQCDLDWFFFKLKESTTHTLGSSVKSFSPGLEAVWSEILNRSQRWSLKY